MIDYVVKGPLARITLNRPEKRNALNAQMLDELSEALEHSSREPAAKVVVIDSEGKDFCAGMDLAALNQAADHSAMEQLESARGLAAVYLSIRNHPRPVIAAVRGRALGGGCGLATACDVILAADSAQFGYPEVKIGFVPAIVASLLRRSLSERAAFELLTSGELISAASAAALGLINYVYPGEEWDAAVEAYAANLAEKSASAITLTKRLLHHIDGMTLESAVESGVHFNVLARRGLHLKK